VLPGPFKPVAALTVDYGQRGARQELESASRLAARFGLEHFKYDLSTFNRLCGSASALMGDSAMPSPESLDDPAITVKSAAAVWVPNRNGVLISLAAALAESHGWGAVAVGFNAEEAVTFPDNTREFMTVMTKALSYSTANHVEVVSATAELNKIQIVERLAAANFPFEMLWSCYLSGEKHCGKCESCKRLDRAIQGGLTGGRRAQVLDRLFGAKVPS
jgi:7-cyano-7-deazaguanine synthase